MTDAEVLELEASRARFKRLRRRRHALEEELLSRSCEFGLSRGVKVLDVIAVRGELADLGPVLVKLRRKICKLLLKAEREHRAS